MLLKVPLNTNKTGQHVVSYNRYIVESGIEYQETDHNVILFLKMALNTTKTDRQFRIFRIQNRLFGNIVFQLKPDLIYRL
jgi:hypothetical protein